VDAIIVEGGQRLKGSVRISGSKNSALPIMMASVLIRGQSELTNVPHLRDVGTTRKLLIYLGSEVSPLRRGKIIINTRPIRRKEVPYELVKTMRASVLLLGPLLARFKKARVSLPGGCAIGARPINYHLMAFEKMGAKFSIDSGYVLAEVKKLKGADIRFPEKTVTGTENVLMAACLAEGKTILRNAAQEPEIVDLAEYLCAAGAKIIGAGTDTIVITGVKKLTECSHRIMSDRIEAGTFMVAAGITRGDILLKGIRLETMRAVVDKLREAGLHIQEENGGIRVWCKRRPKGVDLVTHPYPGFPTDMQAQFMVLMSIANSKSVITETIFENRFMHVSELGRMGAQIRIEGKNAIVKGVNRLGSAKLMATDLRASASLVLAGLCTKGKTRISRVYHIDRGYEHIERKLRSLGAKIRRTSK